MEDSSFRDNMIRDAFKIVQEKIEN